MVFIGTAIVSGGRRQEWVGLSREHDRGDMAICRTTAGFKNTMAPKTRKDGVVVRTPGNSD